jgi:DDE superfamily endonuclease
VSPPVATPISVGGPPAWLTVSPNSSRVYVTNSGSDPGSVDAPSAADPGINPEVSTDRAPAYPRVVDELLPTACHIVEQYANNPIEADHSRWKARLRPMRGLKQLRSARVVSAGHAFVQNLRRGHYELGLHVHPRHRLPAIFTELTLAI